MVKIPRLFLHRNSEKSNQHRSGNLQRHFIWRVLIPPFFILMVLGLVIFWQLNNFVRSQAIDDLQRASSTTAVRLEREFAIRQTVLKRTGQDLFIAKSNYKTAKESLDAKRDACRAHIQRFGNFFNASEDACEPFLPEFAKLGAWSLQAVDEGYVRAGAELTKDQNQRINNLLAAYSQFFPETMTLLVVDEEGRTVSSAVSDSINEDAPSLEPIAVEAQTDAVEGRLTKINDTRLGVFAYPISGGSVLAAYNLDAPDFLHAAWDNTPADKSRSFTVILDSEGAQSYPVLPFASSLQAANEELRQNDHIETSLRDLNHIGVATEAGASEWLVVVASPAAVVLAPLRDAQLLAVLVIGTLLVGFLWVGAFFIQRTLRSIMGLVSGALVFASGKLDYKIQLENADQEFVQLADTMNKMAERIAAAEKEIDEKNKEFISVATHELRTPMTAILGYLEMTVDEMGTKIHESLQPFVRKAFDGTKRLRDLVNDMLDVARLEGGRQEFNITPLDIKQSVNSVLDSLQITAQEKGITLNYKDTETAYVLADEARLRIILNNFVSNAIKYNRPNGAVNIQHSVKDGKLVMAVADTGLGIPEDQKAHMFEKFFRVQHDDRKDVTGTGLGMYITKQYIEAMGGQLWFESVHGQGTTFYFTLPLALKSKP